jgi:NADH dehydrogenase
VYGENESTTPHQEDDMPQPGTPYERSKLAGEQAMRETLGAAVPWIILRPAGVYGPGRASTEAFLREVRTRRLWLHGPAPVIVQPTFVEDVAGAIAAAAARPDLAGTILNVGGACALAYDAYVAAAAHALGVRARQARLPRVVGAVARAARATGLLPAGLERLARARINRAVDTTRAARLLGLAPVPLADGLAATVAALAPAAGATRRQGGRP